jgi:Tol biopolymer transport system component
LPRESPASIRDLLQRSLAKNPDQRIATMAVVRNLIAESVAGQSDVEAAPARVRVPTYRFRAVSALASITVIAAGYAAYRLLPIRPTVIPRLTNPMQITAAVGLEDYPTWSPDGRTVAYESIQAANWDIWVSQPGGDAAVNRTAEFLGDDRYPSWSPDGRQIAFWSSRDGGGYFLMPAVGGPASKIAATPGTTAIYHGAATWSADGTQLAYVNYQPIGNTFEASLEIVSIVTRDTRRLSLPGVQEARLDLSWSRDGRLIAYVDAAQTNAETTQLRVLSLADGRVLDITDARAKVRSPQWAADGRSLYFVSNRIGAADLWWQPIDQDGTARDQPQQVTSGLEVLHVNLLPTGDTRLAYSKGRWVSNLWRVPLHFDRLATWADAEQITFEEAFIEFVDVSRDSQRIVFSSDRSGNQDIWSMRLGAEPMRLTSDPAPEWAPALSPDQRLIAFYSGRTGDREIWVMPAEGGQARQLTSSAGLDAGNGWSPDGGEIAFRSERLGSSDVWVIKADGSDPRVLAPDPAGDYSPDFSPDGRWLAFWSNRGGVHQIWRVPRAGGGPEPLAAGFGPPTWSRDGAHVLFFRTSEGSTNLWAVSVSTRQARPLTRLTGRRGTLGTMGIATDGTYLYFAWRDDIGDIWVSDIIPGE